MRIVHYIFGMPPLRGGGAIKYAMDLAEKQAELDQNVSIIYPGEIRKTTEKVSIRKNKCYYKVSVYEIINPLPVPLVTGIKEIEPFIKKADKAIYAQFLQEEKVEIMHIHSLMGLHIEFLEAAKECGVKIVFTTHDYFGICPKTNLLYRGQICMDCGWENCGECCADAEDVSTLIKRQTHWFQFLIRSKLLVRLKHKLAGAGRNSTESVKRNLEEEQSIEKKKADISYERLRQYYLDELGLVDVMLYNSSVAKQQYEKRIKPNNSIIIGGMHKEIRDGRRYREYSSIVRFAYLGYPVEFKGYQLLIQVFDELDKKYHGQFELNMYMGKTEYDRQYIKYHEPFSYNELEKVYRNIDMLVVPSLCAETYGLVVLEALSYGVPVVVTNNVGASDLLRENSGIGYIVEPNHESLYSALEQVIEDGIVLQRFNRAICEATIDLDYENYVRQMIEVYQQF